ncbi:MAG: DUF3078 domain-containing protein [Chitinophagales bacterium]|nr:DUF3078 domain-containing protein [Chitinophagales bacterium]MDW8394056.1 DUF3078 domain-containing protein [Chitinophagales bacterium]
MKPNSIFQFFLAGGGILFILSQQLSAQTVGADTSWKKGGYGSLQFNQVAFSHWAAGGENSLSLTTLGYAYANYTKGKNYWHNSAFLNYGFIQSQYVRGIRKNTDLIDLNSKAGREFKGNFYYTALVNFRSQFAPGYIYPNDSDVVSRFLAPAYLTASAGIEWKPYSYLTFYFSPATGRFIFVASQDIANIVINGASQWGNPPAVYDTLGNLVKNGGKVRTEFGALFTASFNKEVVKNVTVNTRLQLFNNYTDADRLNRRNIDVFYDLFINMNVNKYITASFFTNIIYDHNVTIADLDKNGQPTGTAGPRTQIKEGMGVGLTYTFGDPVK